MSHTALGGMHARTAEFFLSHYLSGHCLHDSRTCKEHIGSVLYHYSKIGQGRRIHRTTGTRTENP